MSDSNPENIHHEEDFTDWLREKTGGDESLIGDDCAILSQFDPPVLLTQDTLVEGVHYDERYTYEEIGAKLAGVNLSDVAAMGGTPRWAMLSLTSDTGTPELKRLVQGVLSVLANHDVTLVGGDTSSSGDCGDTYSLAIMGQSAPDGLLARSNAKPGDRLAISGQLGAPTAVRECTESLTEEERSSLVRIPDRVTLGQKLVQEGVRCGIDVSDGLLKDLNRICRSSEVGVVLDPETIPIHPLALKHASNRKEALRWALSGGEDFELLVTVSPDLEFLFEKHDLTMIGEVQDGDGIRWEPKLPEEIDFTELGYDHLAQNS